VLAFSAYDDPGIVLDMLRAGAAGYLLKGTPADEIVDAILRCAAGDAVFSPDLVADERSEIARYLRDRGT
jgi:DNA-binding NarL/FixJ family response regulator